MRLSFHLPFAPAAMDTCTLNVFRMWVQAEAANAAAELARCEQAFASAAQAYEAHVQEEPWRHGEIPTDEEDNRFETVLNAAVDAQAELKTAQPRAEAASRMLAKVCMLCR